MLRPFLIMAMVSIAVYSCCGCSKPQENPDGPQTENPAVSWKEYGESGFKVLVSESYEWDARKDMAFKYLSKSLEYFSYMLPEGILAQLQAIPIVLLSEQKEDVPDLGTAVVVEDIASVYENNRADLGTVILGDLAGLWYEDHGQGNGVGPEQFSAWTMAYWGIAAEEPADYHQLMEQDPEGFGLMEEIWGSRSLKDYARVNMEGFRVMYPLQYAGSEELPEALDALGEDLKFIVNTVPAPFVDVFRRKILWLDNTDPDGAACYHDGMDWLIQNGYIKEKHRCVEINNMRNYVQWSSSNQPLMVLHEFAHLFHYSSYRDSQLILSAYENALNAGLYESVDYYDGTSVSKRKAYAMNNEMEYFAEMSEAWFGTNDYYPFDRDDLEVHDPQAWKLMQEVWNIDNFTE